MAPLCLVKHPQHLRWARPHRLADSGGSFQSIQCLLSAFPKGKVCVCLGLSYITCTHYIQWPWGLMTKMVLEPLGQARQEISFLSGCF